MSDVATRRNTAYISSTLEKLQPARLSLMQFASSTSVCRLILKVAQGFSCAFFPCLLLPQKEAGHSRNSTLMQMAKDVFRSCIRMQWPACKAHRLKYFNCMLKHNCALQHTWMVALPCRALSRRNAPYAESEGPSMWTPAVYAMVVSRRESTQAVPCQAQA
jgi:hypothetical protein